MKMKKSSEETIGKVLAALRNSDVPPGMERRILKAVHDHASAQSRSGLALVEAELAGSASTFDPN